MEAQRGLILISKLLQNLSNGIEFDESQEKHLADFNKFLSEKMVTIQNFFNKLAVSNPKNIFGNAHRINQMLLIMGFR
ncbi:MAG: hypothetical protein ACK42G_06950 [Candidatus Kapaibacteriota bacterium]